jgi:hypothetical protein
LQNDLSAILRAARLPSRETKTWVGTLPKEYLKTGDKLD